jgi:hypothetical protein
MKKQIVVIHGGTTFNTYKEYILYLKNQAVKIEKFKTRKDWKDSLEKESGTDFEILAPRMPNKTNARYKEWQIWFERMIPFINDDIVFVGHSLGGIFLAKYLSENLFPKKIKMVLLVSAPFDGEGVIEESLSDFALPPSLEKFAAQAGKIYLLHSKDDPVVPFEHINKYKKALPDSETIVFADRQHFNQESFPEIVALLKDI